SAHFLNSIPAIGGLTHSIHKITPLFGSLLSQLLILNSFNDRKGRSAGQRISAIGRSVFPVFKSISYVISCNHSANRKASASRLCRVHNIRLYVILLVGIHAAGTPSAALYFINNKLRTVLITNFADLLLILLIGRMYAPFSFNG